jgi:hypothetical protein
MTANANIQSNENTATQKTNKIKIKKDGDMNNENNTNIVTRVSNTFRMGTIGKLVTGATLSVALTAGVAMTNMNSTPNVAEISGLSEENLETVLASYNVVGFGNMSEENLEAVPANYTVAGFAGMSEENLETVPASYNVVGFGNMSEENLEVVPATYTVAGFDGMSEENTTVLNG